METLDLARRWIAEGTLPRRAWTGAWCVVQGVTLTLRSPTLLRLALVPVAINVVLYIAFGYAAWHGIEPVHAWLFPGPAPEAWYAFLYVAARALAWLAIAAVFFLTALIAVVIVGGIIASPVLDAISARAERLLTGVEPPPGPSAVESVLRTVRAQLTLVLFYVVGLAVSGMAYVIPGAGVVLGPLAHALVSVVFLCLGYLEWPAERRHLGPRDRLALVGRHKAVSVGFGAAAWFLMLLPFTLPFLATAGTLLFLTIHNRAEGGAARA